MLEKPNYTETVASELNFKTYQTKAVLEMLQEGATVPFMARYRKEKTGNLDENEIRDIIELKNKQENLYNSKITAINGITEAGKMTDEIMNNLINALTLKEVEEIYKPYKSKKKTKAMIAIEKGFGIVAEKLKENKIIISEALLKDYSREEIIDGAIEIVGAEVNGNSILRHKLIKELQETGIILSSKKTAKSLEKLNEKDKEQIAKFDIYKDFSIRINHIKPYQILALNRGENLGILNVKLEKDDGIYGQIEKKYKHILNLSSFISELKEAFKRGYENLFSSVENELRSDLNEIGEDDSIKVFQTNLNALLMTKPEKIKNMLSVDPGFRVGCKLCVLDELGNPIHFNKIYLHEEEKAKIIIKDIIKKFEIEVIVIGNGTGSKEVSSLIKDISNKDVFIVNEAGASVYSVSKLAEKEFPKLDSLDRGTISIGRRYIDPLSELVKVPVGSIGVGMYQHDIPEKKLEQKLGYIVEEAVNEVGININNASIHVLNHISGIDKRQAKKIYENRPYKSRIELKKVLSEKAYEQAIGFLRIPGSKEELDNTDIHPEQYKLAKYIIENKKTKFEENMKELYTDANQDTINFIWDSYKNLGKEKRINSTHIKANNSNNDISVGVIIEGMVRNVVAFGAFVDIGTKNDGLIHISNLADCFVKNPMDIVKVGDKVKVQILNIDEKGKIQLKKV